MNIYTTMKLKHPYQNHYQKYYLYKEEFDNIVKPEIAYLLGLLWADGWVCTKGSSGAGHCLALQTLKADALEYEPVFQSTGVWSVRQYIGKLNNKEMYTFSVTNKLDVTPFINWDYKTKATSSPEKVLSSIPKHLQVYFFRGWIDGDGCFYYGEKRSCRQFIMSGSHDQPWGCFVNFLEENNISCKLRQITRPNGNSSSTLLVIGRENFEKLHKLIYNNYEVDTLGLTRKFKKSKLIIDSYPVIRRIEVFKDEVKLGTYTPKELKQLFNIGSVGIHSVLSNKNRTTRGYILKLETTSNVTGG